VVVIPPPHTCCAAQRVKQDVDRYGDLLTKLAEDIRRLRPISMDEAVAFARRMDKRLSYLVDEEAVVAQLDWPADKVEALREACKLYCDLMNKKTMMASGGVSGKEAAESRMTLERVSLQCF
jgi:hypothetical protein